MQDHADPFQPPVGGMLWVNPEDADVSAGAGERPLEDLDGGRLAGTIGTQERGHLGAFGMQIDSRDGFDVAVGLVQAANRITASGSGKVR